MLPIIPWGFSFIWNEIPVLITFESDWQRAKEILLNIAEEQSGDMKELARRRIQEASKKFLIFYENLSPIVYTRVKDSGILLTIRYLCEPKKKRSTESQIWEEVISYFAEEKDIGIAYPTNRIYLRGNQEEKLRSHGMDGEDYFND